MLGKIIKHFITGVVLFLCGLIVLRCCVSADRSALTDLTATPEMISAYADGILDVQKLEQNAAEISPDGYFSVYGFRYIPEARQLQVTIRYNVSLYGYIAMEEDTPLDFLLCRNDDPESLLAPAQVIDESRSIYRYKKLIFNDVEIGADNWQIWLDLQDGTYSTSPLRYAEQELLPYNLSGWEKKALAGE